MMNHSTRHPSRHEQGFALVVIAALFLAFSVVAAAIISRGNDTRQIIRQQNTAEQLRRLSRALIEWSANNSNRFPCPARLDRAGAGVAYTGSSDYGPDPQFGVPVSYCASGALEGLDVLTSTDYTNVRGVVPVRALADYGIDVNDATDAWGGRILYIVNRHITPTSDGITTSGELPTVTIYPSDTNRTIYQPDFLLISYGRDGLGGYQRTATSVSLACPNDGLDRSENCDDDIAFTVRPVRIGTGVTVSTYFDDILAFYRQSN